jgi:hypothetical protein
MKKIILLSALSLGLPFAAFASTYDYVNTSGNVETITATTPDAAIAAASDIAQHSGVALDSGTIVVVGNSLYEYVDINGNLDTIQAASANAALAMATHIASHSGVLAL